MKRLIIAIFLSSMFIGANAQSYKEGDQLLNIGVGLSDNRYNVIPPLVLTYEVGIHKYISVGAYFNLGAGRDSYPERRQWYSPDPNHPHYWAGGYRYYSYDVRENWTHFGFGARGSFHFSPLIDLNDFDLYAGLGLGTRYERWSRTVTSNAGPWSDHLETSSAGLRNWGAGLFIGGKWFFQDNMGLWTEFGVVNSVWWQFGLALKL